MLDQTVTSVDVALNTILADNNIYNQFSISEDDYSLSPEFIQSVVRTDYGRRTKAKDPERKDCSFIYNIEILYEFPIFGLKIVTPALVQSLAC